MIVAIASISLYDPNPNRVLTTLRWVLLAVLILLTIGTGALILQRLIEREICAVFFIVCSTFAHIAITVIEGTSADPGQFVLTFALLYMFGDVVKFVFLKVEDEFQVALLPRPRLFALTALTLFLYAGVVVLQVMVWVLDYPVVS